MRIIFAILIFICSQLLLSCNTIKPYQKVYLNDVDMKPGGRPTSIYVQNFQRYREGASGGNAAKAVGGCGCN